MTLKLPDKRAGVIVGRCPDFVLRERSDLLRVFVYAPLAMRAERIVALYGERDDSPEKRAGQGQTPRRLLSSPHAAERDLCLYSGTIGIDRCAHLITELY